MNKITRRGFLRLSGLGLFTPYVLIGSRSSAHSDEGLSFSLTRDETVWFRFEPNRNAEEVFGLSVASGDPSPTGVILWTRVNPAAWSPGDSLAFEVAQDPEFSQVLVRGLVDGSEIKPEHDFTVKVDLNGQLLPNRYFYYRFIYRQTVSRTGRCRTLPESTESVDRIKFAVLTCQDYTNGYYGALSHLSQESDVDFVIHLGDFIYESASAPGNTGLPYPDRLVVLPSGQSAAFNLDDFRSIYRTYRSDYFLQRALEQHTWIIIWDDHETANDCYWNYDRDTLGAPDHPLTKDREFGNDPDLLRQLKLAAQRAWTEYVPARVTVNEGVTHPHQFLQIYRNFRFGKLLELFMTDERTYRSSHPCGEREIGDRYASLGCNQQFNANRTMLGLTQRDWLVQGIKSSGSLWKVWGNEVFQAPLRLTQIARSFYINLDAWDGYASERSYISKQLKQANVRNLIVLTGDLHSSLASYLKINYESDPFNLLQSNMIGVEFMTPSITSSNLGQILNQQGLILDISEFVVRATNPHLRFFDIESWGYSTVEFNHEYCEYTVFDIDKSQNNANVNKRVLKRLRVPVNKVKIIEA